MAGNARLAANDFALGRLADAVAQHAELGEHVK